MNGLGESFRGEADPIQTFRIVGEQILMRKQQITVHRKYNIFDMSDADALDTFPTAIHKPEDYR